jgi:hypothetical protein
MIIDDDTPSHSGTKRQQDHTAMNTACADPKLAEGCGIGIVGVRDIDSDLLFKASNNWEIVPMRVIRWGDQHPFRNVLATRRSEANSLNSCERDTGFDTEGFCRRGSSLHGIGGPLGLLRWYRDEAKGASLVIYQPKLDAGSSYINPDPKGRFSVLE